MLADIPDNVALQLLDRCPNLCFVSKRFYGLSEYASRKTINRRNGYKRSLLTDALAEDVHELFGFESWKTVDFVSRFDFWFFDPTNILNLHPEDLKVIESPQVDNWPVSAVKKSGGPWSIINKMPWGSSLYAATVSILNLSYTTKLGPGIYRVCMNIRARELMDLIPVRFAINGGKNVHHCGREFASYGVVLPCVRPGSAEYSSLRPYEICIAHVVITGDELETVRMEIEDFGPFVHHHLVFNYIYFEWVGDAPAVRDWPCEDWRIVEPRFTPTTEWRSLYDRSRARKLQAATS